MNCWHFYQHLMFCATALSWKNRIGTTKTLPKNATFAKLEAHLIEQKQMLNFLYKEPLITRMKTSNSKVGRKYASYERLL